MERLNCLYIENQVGHQEMYGSRIAEAWKLISLDIPINIDIEADPLIAVEKFRESSGHYQLVIADIFFEVDEQEEEQPIGYQAIHSIRNSSPNTAIIVLTSGRGGGEAWADPDYVDAYVSKGAVNNSLNYEYLAGRIREAMSKRGFSLHSASADVIEYDQRNLELSWIVESIGPQTLSDIIQRIVRQDLIVAKIGYLKPGYSGAHVLRAECRFSSGPRQYRLIKLSREKEPLQREFDNQDLTRAFPPILLIRFGDLPPVESNGWYAISTDLELTATTLLSWLETQPSNSPEIATLLSRLFAGDDGLQRLYRDPDFRSESPVEAVSNMLGWGRKPRILLALKELSPLAEKFAPSGVFEALLLERFIRSGRVGDLDKSELSVTGVPYLLSHGDFHSGNVLVTGTGMPRIIDPANVQYLPWAADIARLSVDLIISGMDSGIASHEWDSLAAWNDYTHNFIKGTIPKSESSDGTEGALNWIRANLFNVTEMHGRPELAEAEFRLLLALEFARAAYRGQDSTSPKRVLAVLSACNAIRESEAALQAL